MLHSNNNSELVLRSAIQSLPRCPLLDAVAPRVLNRDTLHLPSPPPPPPIPRKGLTAPQVSCSAAPRPACTFGGGSCCFTPLSPKYISWYSFQIREGQTLHQCWQWWPGQQPQPHTSLLCSAPPTSRHWAALWWVHQPPSAWLFAGINKLLLWALLHPKAEQGLFHEIRRVFHQLPQPCSITSAAKTRSPRLQLWGISLYFTF